MEVNGTCLPSNFLIDKAKTEGQLLDCLIFDYGAVAIQAGPHVHPRRDRCCFRFVAYATYRAAFQDAIQGIPIHCRIVEGWIVHKRQRAVPHQVQRWHLDSRSHGAEICINFVQQLMRGVGLAWAVLGDLTYMYRTLGLIVFSIVVIIITDSNRRGSCSCSVQ